MWSRGSGLLEFPEEGIKGVVVLGGGGNIWWVDVVGSNIVRHHIWDLSF